jgi:hypothetical protein
MYRQVFSAASLVSDGPTKYRTRSSELLPLCVSCLVICMTRIPYKLWNGKIVSLCDTKTHFASFFYDPPSDIEAFLDINILG